MTSDSLDSIQRHAAAARKLLFELRNVFFPNSRPSPFSAKFLVYSCARKDRARAHICIHEYETRQVYIFDIRISVFLFFACAERNKLFELTNRFCVVIKKNFRRVSEHAHKLQRRIDAPGWPEIRPNLRSKQVSNRPTIQRVNVNFNLHFALIFRFLFPLSLYIYRQLLSRLANKKNPLRSPYR